MKPFNVMAHWESPYPKTSFVKRSFTLPKANCASIRINFDVCMKRCILNLLTIPQLRAAYLFQFEDNHTQWSVYEPNNASLTSLEVRGALLLSMREMKRDRTTMFLNIKAKSKPYITNVKPIVQTIENMGKNERFFAVFVFKNVVFMSGNYYDESSLCHALSSFQSRKEGPKVRIQPDLLISRKSPENLKRW